MGNLELKALKSYKEALENKITYLGDNSVSNYTMGNYKLKDLIKDMQEYTHSKIEVIEVDTKIIELTLKLQALGTTHKGCSHD